MDHLLRSEGVDEEREVRLRSSSEGSKGEVQNVLAQDTYRGGREGSRSRSREDLPRYLSETPPRTPSPPASFYEDAGTPREDHAPSPPPSRLTSPTQQEPDERECKDPSESCIKMIGEIQEEGNRDERLAKLVGLLEIVQSAEEADKMSLIQLLHNNLDMIDPCLDTGPFYMITEGIYCGGVDGTRDPKLLKLYNINCILTLAERIEPDFPGEIDYKVIKIKDDPLSCIGEHFNESYQWIQYRLAEKKNFLVHCKAGVSRSGAIVCAYLMRNNGWSAEHALKFARSRRRIIQPNPGFMAQLKVYEKKNYVQDIRIDWWEELERLDVETKKEYEERQSKAEGTT